MKPEIDYERDGKSEDVFRITINGKRIGPPLYFMELCGAKHWIEQSWPDLVVAVLASSHVEQPKKKRKVSK